MACAFTLGEVRTIYNRVRMLATIWYHQAAVREPNSAAHETAIKWAVG
jgi:hypothetical protein